MDLFEYQGKQYFARFGIPVSPAARPTRSTKPSPWPSRRLPRGGQGAGAGGRPRQGRRHQARQRRRRGAPPRREHPRHGHQGPPGQAHLGRARQRHRRGVLRQLHPRPQRQEAPRACSVGPGRRGHRGRVAEDPDAIAKLWIDPVDGLSTSGPPGRRGSKIPPSSTPAPTTARRHPGASSTTAYTEGDATSPRSTRSSSSPPARCTPSTPRCPSTATPSSATPSGPSTKATEERDEREKLAHEKGLQYIGLDGTVGIIANGAGLAMSTLDVVNQVGGKPPTSSTSAAAPTPT
jgi:succinyl-CoA synthetase beta subunit